MQEIISTCADYGALDSYLLRTGAGKILLVCGNSAAALKPGRYFAGLEQRLGIRVVRFSDFKPNPDYSAAVKGTALLRETGCDLIAAVGGGSAMDVAKCIKLYANMDPGSSYFTQPIVPNSIPLLAIPTTAGTGSEATRYAVIYYQGQKQSVTHDSAVPGAVFFDPSVLCSLPDYHRKATMLDALCHAVESYWSVHSTPESRRDARTALGMIADHAAGYLANTADGNEQMLRAANIAGKAINISATTAGHAMSYQLTSMYGLAHGHAAALCVRVLFPFLLAHPERCTDPRGSVHLEQVTEEIAQALRCPTPEAAAEWFSKFVDRLSLPQPELRSRADLKTLSESVNQGRLSNHPVRLTPDDLYALYAEIFRTEP